MTDRYVDQAFRQERKQAQDRKVDWIERIRQSIIGDKHPISTPFGKKPLIYADYTASGRSLTFIEDAIRQRVLPFYANTHTESTYTGAHSTRLREEARNAIRRSLHADASDAVIFTGAGATSAINKFIDMLGLRRTSTGSNEEITGEERPVVFVSAYEHHSNELPWRESAAEVVTVPLSSDGTLDCSALKALLLAYQERPLLIGSFSAASNVTGILTDVSRVSRLLKDFGALACWDFAAAGPYTEIRMNGDVALDAVFLSPHKFIGGPGTPGVLVVKRSLVAARVPAVSGGGTVAWVGPDAHYYVADIERREEGGTPAIVESIRAGLVFALKDRVGSARIAELEHRFIQRAFARLDGCSNVEILGPHDAPRLAILSMRFKHGGFDLHYGFVVALLNDLFGIQARGGCSCAGPYGHYLLGISAEQSNALAHAVTHGAAVLRPGWVRLGFNYFIADAEFDYIISAIELVARHGWRLLPFYRYDNRSGTWQANRAQPVGCTELASAQPDLPQIDGLLDDKNHSRDANRDVASYAVGPTWCFVELLSQAEDAMLNQTGLVAIDAEAACFQHNAQWEALGWFARPVANAVTG